MTRSAAEAFDLRAGNCLSRVIMTGALAKELGLPVYYQRVHSEETWTRDAIANDSGFLDAYHTLGVVYSRHGNPRETERAYRHVLEHEPEDPTVMSNLATAMRATGRLEAAQALLQELRRIESYPPLQFLNQAQFALKSGDFRAAIALFNEELARNPSYHAAYFGLAAAYFELGDFTSARENLTAAMQNSTTRRDHELYAAKLERLRSYEAR